MTRPGRRLSVLVLRALGLGDLLTAVPALRGLRRSAPGDRITLATSPGLVQLAAHAAPVDDVVATEGLDGPLPHGFDVAVNLHGRGPESTGLLRSTEPGRLVAFGEPGCPAWVEDEHERTRWCRLVGGEPDDVVVDPPPARLRVGPRGAVVVHPGAAFPARRWPVARWAAVAASLVREGCDVVVTGSSAERPLAVEVARGAGLGAASVLAGRTSPMELLALVADARLVLSGDTGVAHVAVGTRTPSVTLFGPEPPSRWGPPPGPHEVLWAGALGDPRGDVVHPGLLEIGVPDVRAAVGRLLGSPAARSA